jgi:hypothetical protein
MAFDSEVHHRRSIRLSGYDYSESGAYFLTLCVRDMKPLFGRVAEGKMGLSPTGLVVQECWLEIPRHFRQVELDEFVVMPNHLHGILLFTVGARHGVPEVANVGARHPDFAGTGAVPLQSPEAPRRRSAGTSPQTPRRGVSASCSGGVPAVELLRRWGHRRYSRQDAGATALGSLIGRGCLSR